MRGIWWLVAAVALGLSLAWLAAQTPRPRPLDAPATVFSAERAMADVRAIAREPHPTGSPENARVRDHLLGRLRALSLNAEVRPATVSGRRLENVVAVLPGTRREAPALLLMAHYDSVPESPGAADDAAGVAAILETIRAIQASGARPRRDVVVLLTDGEEAGLLGARAYFGGAEARRIGAVLNFEARGGGGRAHMFETGPGAAEFIALYDAQVRSPSANSLMRFVYERMPNGTDFTLPKRQGIPGLNFAFLGDYAAYHTPLATPERLDRGSLQHMGDQALALTKALAEAPRLPVATEDLVYSDLFGLVLIRYPKPLGWAVLAAAAGLLGWAGWRVRHELSAGGVAFGALRLLGGTLLAGALLFAAGRALGAGPEMPSVGLREAAPWILAGFGALIAVGILTTHAGLRRPHAAGLGALGLGWILAAGLQAAAPETAVVLAWPVLWGALAVAVLPSAGRWRGPLAVVCGALGLAWIAGLLHLLFLGVGFLAPAALATGALLPPLVLHPVLPAQAATRRDAALT